MPHQQLRRKKAGAELVRNFYLVRGLELPFPLEIPLEEGSDRKLYRAIARIGMDPNHLLRPVSVRDRQLPR